MNESQLDVIPEKSFDDGSIAGGLRKLGETFDLDQTVDAKVEPQITS